MKRLNHHPTHKVMCTKIGMDSYYNEQTKTLEPVTLLKLECNNVLEAGNYYSKIFVPNVGGKLSQPNQGQLRNRNIDAKKGKFYQARGAKLQTNETSEILITNFTVGDFVDIQGNSKGKGFCGVMKRHNFSGQRKSHGASLSHNTMGSTGSQDTGRVIKGKKMPGRSGGTTVTVENQKVMAIDEQNNVIVVKGSVPGNKGANVFVRSSLKQYNLQNPHKGNSDAEAELKSKKRNKGDK